jgi:hypothetical protein
MTDDERTKGPIGQAIDALVYAPIGLFFDGPSLLPKLVEDGRNHAKGARVFGEFAVRQGRAELSRRLSSFGVQAEEVLRILGVLPDDEAEPPGPPGSGVTAPRGPWATARAGTGTAGGGAGAAGNGFAGDEATPEAPPVETLAITDYDSLSASQVVTRLDGLEPEELEAVRAYESAHRGRKTILNKVAQIQA